MSNIRLRNVTKRFGSTVTLHQINLDIEDGEFAVFVGPSGCGKSTLLRMIAGLEEVSEGEVLIGDEVMNDVVPARRGVAMVFQSYALYPHMTVAENMGYGLKVKRCSSRTCWIVNRSSSLAASGSAWPLAGRSCVIPGCLCSMSRSLTSMRSCASICACILPVCTRS